MSKLPVEEYSSLEQHYKPHVNWVDMEGPVVKQAFATVALSKQELCSKSPSAKDTKRAVSCARHCRLPSNWDVGHRRLLEQHFRATEAFGNEDVSV